MKRDSNNANIRIDLTAKAQRLGLCPNRGDVMVQMEQPLINEAVALYETVGSTRKLHWIECLDAFMNQARQELAQAPAGSRSFNFNIAMPHRCVEVHVEVEQQQQLRKNLLVFSLAKRNRQAA